MKCFYDLHIHTCLSPCCDDESTPHSVAAMGYLNGLDIIAVADHNSARNVRAVTNAAKEFNITVVPGIEAETAESIHMLCLFDTLEGAEDMGALLESHLPPIKNRPDIFGNQIIMDEVDEETGRLDTLLINSTDIPVEQMIAEAALRGGIAIPAHIDREANGMVSILGSVPKELGFSTIELSTRAGENYIGEKCYRYIRNSDAHLLTDISERVNFMELEEKSTKCVIKTLKDKLHTVL